MNSRVNRYRDFGFLDLNSGFQSPGFPVPNLTIPNCTNKIIPDSEIRISLHRVHETIRNDDFLRNTALPHCCNSVPNGCNIVPALRRCVALKIVVANHSVLHHLHTRENSRAHRIGLTVLLNMILSDVALNKLLTISDFILALNVGSK